MKINRIFFEYCARDPSELREHRRPEIAFIGRSNVGKSSALNCLAGQRRLARVSKTPGRTDGLYFYRVNDRFYWVDFPGYGYARRSHEMRSRWQIIAEHYLAYRANLKGIIFLLDARHAPTPVDKQMMEWLVPFNRKMLLVLTKADLVRSGERGRREKEVRQWGQSYGYNDIIWFSSKTREGRTAVLAWIRNQIEEVHR